MWDPSNDGPGNDLDADKIPRRLWMKYWLYRMRCKEKIFLAALITGILLGTAAYFYVMGSLFYEFWTAKK